MDPQAIAVMAGLIFPLYLALIGLYVKIGKYDQVCNEVHDLQGKVDRHLESRGD